MNRFGGVLVRLEERYSLDLNLMLAILVYENLNRPRAIRIIERLFVRLPGISLTVGIAQVLSGRALSDVESIERMGVLLRESLLEASEITDLCDRYSFALSQYNSGAKYVSEVLQIYRQISV